MANPLPLRFFAGYTENRGEGTDIMGFQLAIDEMRISADSVQRLDLSDVFIDHTSWLAAVNEVILFRPGQVRMPLPPESFDHWLQGLSHRGLSDQPSIGRLRRSRDRIIKQARALCSRKTSPDVETYRHFTQMFQDFLLQIRRVETAFRLAESNIDLLTGLRSRAGMREELEREYERFKRTEKAFCIAICDIDHFKKINDVYGHRLGDQALAHIAAAIFSNIRAFDEAYRIGGEEFLICLKEAELGVGLTVLERLRRYIEANPLVPEGGEPIPLTASFGVVESHMDQSLQSLIDQADRALYRAKRSGRNRVHAMVHCGGGKQGELRLTLPTDDIMPEDGDGEDALYQYEGTGEIS